MRQAGDDGARGKYLGIGRQHDRRHRAASRKAGDENATGINAMIERHLLDHLADREGFPSAPFDVARLKPVETTQRVVRPLLLRHEKGKTIPIR